MTETRASSASVYVSSVPVLSRDPVFQHLKPISAKAFEVCRPSKPSSLLTMVKYTFYLRQAKFFSQFKTIFYRQNMNVYLAYLIFYNWLTQSIALTLIS